jgi:hypothetical protein
MTYEERNAYAEKLRAQAQEMNLQDADYIVVYSKGYTQHVSCYKSALAAAALYDIRTREGAFATVFVGKRVFGL